MRFLEKSIDSAAAEAALAEARRGLASRRAGAGDESDLDRARYAAQAEQAAAKLAVWKEYGGR